MTKAEIAQKIEEKAAFQICMESKGIQGAREHAANVVQLRKELEAAPES
jgi:hypothetical protein